MNHIDERTLALLDSGELDAQMAADAESHLSECSPCKALSANFATSGQWLRSLRTEPDANELAALTTGTLSRMAVHHSQWKFWLAASGIAAAVVLGLLLIASRRLTPVAQPPVMAQISRPHATQAAHASPNIAKAEPVVRSVRAKVRARTDRPRLESVSLISQKDGPPILKMTTNDPNVVILWVMNGNPPQPEVSNE